MPQCGGADCPECESVCVSWRGEQAAGVGAPGCTVCPAAEADPAGWEPGPAMQGEALIGGKEMPGPHSSYTPHLYRPLPGAAGHAGEGICIWVALFSVLHGWQHHRTLSVFWVAVHWSTIASPFIDCCVSYVTKNQTVLLLCTGVPASSSDHTTGQPRPVSLRSGTTGSIWQQPQFRAVKGSHNCCLPQLPGQHRAGRQESERRDPWAAEQWVCQVNLPSLMSAGYQRIM